MNQPGNLNHHSIIPHTRNGIAKNQLIIDNTLNNPSFPLKILRNGKSIHKWIWKYR
jgi:hypothetical protein